MAKILTIRQATRIEGNAQVRIFLDDDGAVDHVHFEVLDFRGFEGFLSGCDLSSVPYIGARVCGICSAAHELAAVKALEEALGVDVSETVTNIREIMLLGLIIKSHALNLCFMVMPDFFGHEAHDIFDLLETHPWLGKLALRLRSAGEQIENAIGGRNIHSAGAVVGGLLRPLRDDIDRVRKLANECLDGAREMNAFLTGAVHQQLEEFPTVAANTMTSLLSDAPDYLTGDTIELRDDAGAIITAFDRSEYPAHISEMTVPWTYSKFPYITDRGWPEGRLTSGPLPRLLTLDHFPTPRADERLQGFKRIATSAPDNPLLNDLARGLEVTYAAERILDLLDAPATADTEVRTQFEPHTARATGTGVLEAPRGTLIHRYTLENGLVTDASIIVPTQQNNAVINAALESIAREHVSEGTLSPKGRKLIGMAVRALDPCLSCAAHAVRSHQFIELVPPPERG